MTRIPRLVIPGVPLHIVQRGNNRSQIFFAPEDYRLYRQLLLDTSRRFNCALHAYVLMTNHVHLLITPQDEQGPARMMQTIGRRFVRTINVRRGRSGTLWEGRFRSMVVSSDRYFFACSRYIELNPVRAGIVERPEDYPWSSYAHNAHGWLDPLVTEHSLYRGLASRTAERPAAYRALFTDALDTETLDLFRRATQRGTGVGEPRPIGSTPCPPTRRSAHGGDRRSLAFRLTTGGVQGL